MQKILSFIFTFIVALSFAQLTANDVKFFVGTGSQTAYFVADFKDGTDDRSYVWGVKFNPGQNITGPQMMQMIKNAEPAFDYILTFNNGFLDKVSFNDHVAQSVPDYWSLWGGSDTNNWSMGGWMNSGTISNGEWYGASYGFSNPTAEAPATPIPAYNSLWFNSSQITNWIGTGSNKSLVVIDFGTDNSNGNANSVVFGIQYNGTITAEQALQLIDAQSSTFNYTSVANQVSTLSLNSLSGTANGTNTWKLYKGTNLSNWKTNANLSTITLTNNDWFGLSFGTRRPFTPTEANVNLSVSNAVKQGFKIYPNPASDFIIIETKDEINTIDIYSISGQKVLNTQSKKINIQSLKSGVYLVEIKTNQSTTTHKIIKK